MRGIRLGRAAWSAVALAVVLTGCGVPTGGAPSTIAPSDVPYGLASPSPTASPTAPPDAVGDTSRVHWISAEDTLVPRTREVSGASRRERLAYLLEQLAAGPSRGERDEQLSTALPPEVELSVTRLDDGTATIDLDALGQAPAGVATRRSVAQIVLTATSVPGVQSVLLQLAGEPVEAPLPSGELTASPLTARDYLSFTTPAPTVAVETAQPEPPAGPPPVEEGPAPPS
ncbi:Sporulation and spore germination [Blastococcus aggregatus]|uniref:Sporulation and spore germination n=1 Tax=Blastococcus aggregatus TaxID=38502 RepID=A0A285V185_9ACTN|nr:GerMN domain-containing protein [Blastococcus aggregatus]SOC47803.1 Sporulation and spore germination [Blastococcus aggregatus]